MCLVLGHIRQIFNSDVTKYIKMCTVDLEYL